MNRVVCLLLVLLGAPAVAQQEPAPPSWPTRTARALAEPGALDALLGVRFLRDAQGGLVVVEAELDDPQQPRTLRCAVSFVVVGGMREERTRLTCAVDLASGRITEVGSAVVRGRSQVFSQGQVADGVLSLQLEARERGESRRREARLDWSPDRVPWSWAVFFLPALRDRLPGEATLRIFHEPTQQLDPGRATWTRTPDGGRWTGLQPPVAIRAGDAGWEVDLGGAGQLTSIDAQTGRRLQQAAAPAEPAPDAPTGAD